MPPAFNLSQDQTLQFNLFLAKTRLTFPSVRAPNPPTTQHLAAPRSVQASTHTSRLFHVFKELVPPNFFRRLLTPSNSERAAAKKRELSFGIAEIELKSLILAQIERWRHALHMQVERQRGGNPGGERRTGE